MNHKTRTIGDIRCDQFSDAPLADLKAAAKDAAEGRGLISAHAFKVASEDKIEIWSIDVWTTEEMT